MSLETCSIGRLVSKIDSSGPSKDSPYFTYVDLSSVDAQTKSISNPKTLPIDGAPSRARQRIAAEDVLVSTVRPNLNGVAKVPQHLDSSIASTGYCVLRPDAARLDPLFLGP